MDGGVSMQSNEERGAEKLMDDYLKSIGLHRKKIAKDGSCLFRAVAEQVLHCQSLHTEVRAKCVAFLKKNRELYEAFIEGDFDDYLYKLQDPQQWVGEVEINALAVMYKKDFLIFQEPGKPAVQITDNKYKDKVQLCFLNGNHYDSVYPIGRIKSAALCQSILYELLYDGVFKVDRSVLGSCQRGARHTDLLTDDNMAACGSSDESDGDAGEALWVEIETTAATRPSRGRGRRGPPLHERLRRSLNPALFRNVEYDVWHKTKRAQQKMDYCIAAGMQFAVGDRCQVRLDGSGRSYSATIKEVPPSDGPVTVFIEELGRKQVPLWNLRPPSDENSWSTVVSRDKRLSNGHGEWEDRSKGRGRGKHIPGSSPASKATALGSGGRVQKQHSWPMQATIEEQGGVKPSRKSVSSAESAFGLTEEQRLAKEEEEKNVALVEIQLRDEHSFPALGSQPGVQGDGGRKKGGEKKRSQRNKTKSPVEDAREPSPSDGERPKSSTPPLVDTTATTALTTTTTSTNPTLSAVSSANSDSSPAGPVTAAVAFNPPVTSAVPIAKTNAPSYAAAAAPSSPPAAAAPHSSSPSVTGGAVPPNLPSSASLFSFLTPALPVASSPATPSTLSSSSPPPSSSSFHPPQSTASPLLSSLQAPTFIAPIAPSPTAAHGFVPPSSLPCCSPPVPSLPRRSPPVPSLPRRSPPVPSLPQCSPPVPSLPHSSPCSAQSSSSSSLIRHAAHVDEAPPASAQTPNGATPAAPQTSQSQAPHSQSHPQVSLPQSQIQTQASLPPVLKPPQPSLNQNKALMPQMQAEAQSSHDHVQHQPQSHTEVASLQQAQIPPFVSHLSQSQSEVAQASHPDPEVSSPHPSQASVPASVQPQPSVVHPHPHAQLTHPSLHSQNQTEALLLPAQPQAHSPAHAPFQQQAHPSHPPQLASVYPHPHPHPQSIPGTVPLHQLSQLYQDLLYPGFPQGEKGDVLQTPPYSSSTSGDDLPQDINILRFFFNLGVKAYGMPMCPPYIYLLPLQQAHTMQPRVPARTPSPTPNYPSSNPPSRHQEAYPHPQYPPTSASMPPQYDQAPPPEPPQLSDNFSQAGYAITEPSPHRMSCPTLSWQQHQIPPPNNSSFPMRYPTPGPPYPVPQHFSHHGVPLYPPGVPAYLPSSLAYQSSTHHEELQVNQGPMEQCPPNKGETPSRVPGSVLANLANANNNRTGFLPGFAVKKDPGESLTRAVLLVDPPLKNKPILVTNSGIKDGPVPMTAMKTSSTPGSMLPYEIISKTTVLSDNNPSRGYRGHQKLLNPNNTYTPLGAPEPSQVSYLSTAAEQTSVSCSTEDDWEETVFKPTQSNHRGSRRNYRGGGRWRGSYDPGRGPNRRRHGGDAGSGLGYHQYNSSHRGRGRERGY